MLKLLTIVVLSLFMLHGCNSDTEVKNEPRALLQVKSLDDIHINVNKNTVYEGEDVIFSLNDTNDVSSIEWKNEAGVLLADTFTFTKSFVDVGDYKIVADIFMEDGRMKSESITIHVLEKVSRVSNVEPSVDAGMAVSAYEGEEVVLTAVGTDQDGSIVKYEWKEGDNILSTSQTLVKNDFTVGQHTLTVIVTDDNGAQAMDNVVVTILPPANNAPEADPKKLYIYSNESKMIVLSGSDPDLNPLTYQVIEAPKHGKLTNGVPNVIYTSDYGYTGKDYFIYIVNDGFVDSEPVTVEINVVYKQKDFGLGTVKGLIRNAISGKGVSDASLIVRVGLDNTTDIPVAVIRTDNDGYYTVNNLREGLYTVEVVKNGFITGYFTIQSIKGEVNDNQNFAISPTLLPGETRIVLTWHEIPRDLDSHLLGPDGNGGSFHIYYSNRTSSGAELDQDITTSYGPETITITQQNDGDYIYYVYDYSHDDPIELSLSGAKVDIYRNDSLVKSYNVPMGSGYYWTVFSLNENTITDINTISDTAPSLP